MNPTIQLKQTTSVFLIIVMFACFGLSPQMRAVSPAPDGCYPAYTTAEGCNALRGLTTGLGNTGLGWYSLFANTGGSFNTAVGTGALLANTADNNTAIGAAALFNNTSGAFNTASGVSTLFSNAQGSYNTADGYSALSANIGGFQNTADGYFALGSNTTGGDNTAIGVGALQNSTTGNNNVALGILAGEGVGTASNVICIGAEGADVSNTTWIGEVYGVTTQSGTTAPVVISDSGQLGTAASSERFKKDIATMGKASQGILSLRPVTFHYKIDARETLQFGLIAEEVAKVNPALVLPDKQGKPYTVRYDAVNAMLLNEFLKEHRKNEKQRATIENLKFTVAKQQATIAQQQKGMKAVIARLNEQAAQIQKVSAQLELNKPAPQAVQNN